MNIHIYTVAPQPATRYTDHHCTPPCEFTTPANRLWWAHCCKRRRPAKNLVVHVYYDHTGVFCAPGKGCKDPKVIRAKARATFKRRSQAMKAAWARRRGAGA